MKVLQCINCHNEWSCPTGDSICPECGCTGIEKSDTPRSSDRHKVSRKPCPICGVDMIEHLELQMKLLNLLKDSE